MATSLVCHHWSFILDYDRISGKCVRNIAPWTVFCVNSLFFIFPLLFSMEIADLLSQIINSITVIIFLNCMKCFGFRKVQEYSKPTLVHCAPGVLLYALVRVVIIRTGCKWEIQKSVTGIGYAICITRRCPACLGGIHTSARLKSLFVITVMLWPTTSSEICFM